MKKEESQKIELKKEETKTTEQLEKEAKARGDATTKAVNINTNYSWIRQELIKMKNNLTRIAKLDEYISKETNADKKTKYDNEKKALETENTDVISKNINSANLELLTLGVKQFNVTSPQTITSIEEDLTRLAPLSKSQLEAVKASLPEMTAMTWVIVIVIFIILCILTFLVITYPIALGLNIAIYIMLKKRYGDKYSSLYLIAIPASFIGTFVLFIPLLF